MRFLALCLLCVMPSFGGTYRATLTQSNTDAPIAREFENSLGEVEYSRIGVGLYRLYCKGAFPDETDILGLRTVVISTQGTTLTFARIMWDDIAADGNSLLIYTYDLNTQNGVETTTDSRLNRTQIDIRIY